MMFRIEYKGFCRLRGRFNKAKKCLTMPNNVTHDSAQLQRWRTCLTTGCAYFSEFEKSWQRVGDSNPDVPYGTAAYKAAPLPFGTTLR